jgi:hypothetical protein
MLLQLLAVGREIRTMVASPTWTRQVPAIRDTRDVQPSAPGSFMSADSDPDAERLDAAAGCEFVDDRIHLRD